MWFSLDTICPIRKTLWKVKWIWSYRAIQHRLPWPVHFSRGLCWKWKWCCCCSCRCCCCCWYLLNLWQQKKGGPRCPRDALGHLCLGSALVFQCHCFWERTAPSPEGQPEAGGPGGFCGMARGLCGKGEGTYPQGLCFHWRCEWHARGFCGNQQLWWTGKLPMHTWNVSLMERWWKYVREKEAECYGLYLFTQKVLHKLA